jgi:hypothetical protein
MPETKYDQGEISCPKQYGGCGRRHSFAVNELLGELEFDLGWESNKGEFWCDKFADWLQEEAEQEWAEEFREDYLKIIGEAEESEEQAEGKRSQREKVKAGVRIDERQYDKEFGRDRPVGYRDGKKEFFICSSCGKDLRGAGKTGKSKNRNNPAFWGLNTPEKVLCLVCVKKQAGQLTSERRKVLNKYVKRGYV